MTLRGGGGWESEGVTLTNQAFFFFTRRGLAIARENVGRRPQVLQKSPAPKALCSSTCNRGKQLEKQQQMKRKKKNKKKNNKKILRTVEERVGMISVWCVGRRKRMMWTLKTGWHVKCGHSGYTKCIPSNHPYSISHADFHCYICLQ